MNRLIATQGIALAHRFVTPPLGLGNLGQNPVALGQICRRIARLFLGFCLDGKWQADLRHCCRDSQCPNRKNEQGQNAFHRFKPVVVKYGAWREPLAPPSIKATSYHPRPMQPMARQPICADRGYHGTIEP